MREVKLRAWVTTYSGGNIMADVLWINFREHVILADNGLQYTDYKLMQFTGLCDRNGKEIYEGDIVRVVGTPYYAPCGAVTYNGKEYGLLYDDGFCADFTWEDWERYFEVIGNVYENPELLEADESLPKFCYDPDSDHCRACLCPTCTYFWATDAGECVEGCELCGGKSWTSCIRYEEEK